MPDVTRTQRDLPGDHRTDWDLMSRIGDVLADRADSWDDGSYRVTVSGDGGEHRVSSVEEAREAVAARGVGDVRATTLEAGGSAYRCRVELAASGGEVVASGPDGTEVEELAGQIERLVRSFGPEPSEPGAAGRESEPGTTSGGPTAGLVAGVVATSLVVVAVVALITGGSVGEVITRPWVITVVGGLAAILISWFLRSWFSRPR